MAYKPNYRYTNKMIRHLSSIAEARAIILNAPLVPKWEVSLRRDALLRNAHSSTAIEGNRLSFEEVSDLAAGRELMVRRKDKQEVLNYLAALDEIPEFADRVPFTVGDLLDVHRLVTIDTLDNSIYEGEFREEQVVVRSGATGKVVFMPPPANDVPFQVEDFVEWFNSEEIIELDPTIEAGLVHYELVRIHPFVDGNGRTARVMAAMTLFKRGFDVKRFFALDDYYAHDRPGYYAALQTVDKDTLDLTEWLEYFLGGVATSLKEVKDRVIGLSKDVKYLKDRGQISLSQRQMKIMEYVLDTGRITNSEIRIMFGISGRAALNEITKLLELQVIERRGMGRNVHYVLK